MPELFGQLPDQPGRPGQQGEPPQQLQRQSEVGQRRPAHSSTVERQRLSQHLRVNPADRGEQFQVGSDQTLLGGDGVQPRGPRIAVLVHVVTQTGHEPALRALLGDRGQRQGVPPSIVGGQDAVLGSQYLVQEPAAVLGHPEEAGTAAEQPGGQRTLNRIRRGQQGQPGGDGGRSEAVIRQRRENRLEHAGLAGGRPALSGQPVGQLAEPDAAHHVVGQVLTQQGDPLPAAGAQCGRVHRPIDLLSHRPPPARSPTRPGPARPADREPAEDNDSRAA